MGLSHDATVIKKYQNLFGWPDETARAIFKFINEELGPTNELEKLSLLVRKIEDIISIYEKDIIYSAREENGLPSGERNLKKEITDCAHHFQDQLYRQVKQRLGLSPIKRVLINVAPFFTHTDFTATRNVGCISWERLSSLLNDVANYHRHPDTLRKQYEACSSADLPLNPTLAHHYDCLKRRRQKMVPRKFLTVLHEQAAKRAKNTGVTEKRKLLNR